MRHDHEAPADHQAVVAYYFTLTAGEDAAIRAVAAQTGTKPSSWMKSTALELARVATETRPTAGKSIK